MRESIPIEFFLEDDFRGDNLNMGGLKSAATVIGELPPEELRFSGVFKLYLGFILIEISKIEESYLVRFQI